MMLGIDALLEVLSGAGVRYIFGNPGSTELPLVDALARDARFTYIFGLHEMPVVAMADGYAMASGGIGCASVHITGGLGNAMGMLFNAYCEGTPLLLMAGQQDRRLAMGEPAMIGDTVSVARPWTKWAAEVQRVEDLPMAVRRAVQTALTAPTGPVFLSLPVDVQLDSAEGLDLSCPCVPDPGVRPPLAALQRAADILAQAHRPAILAGSRVMEAGAFPHLAALAERLGAPVWSEANTAHGRLPMPADHPLYAGMLPLWAPDIRQKLEPFDVLLVVGMKLLRLFIHLGPARPIPEHSRLIQLDSNPWEVGKNYPVEVGLLGDLRVGLEELEEAVARRQTPDQGQVAVQRREKHGQERAREQESLWAKIEAEWPERPMTPFAFMGALARVLPPNAAVVEEAVTTPHALLERLGVLKDPTGFFGHRGWALGWGAGCAVGIKLAWPQRTVLALLGDGAALYGIQALWTAAHHHVPVIFLIANNAQYKILKVSGDVMQLPQMSQRNYVAMDLVEPEVDFVGLARSLGVEATRVTAPDELSDHISGALERTEPLLLDVPIER